MSAHLEREDKYEAADDLQLPVLDDLAGDGGRVERETIPMTNTYFDTPDRALSRAGLTLRRRVGGPDTGWQLKLPGGAGRTELGSRSDRTAPPAELADVVLGLTRGRSLEPVAELATERAVTRLLDADGAVRAEVADDRVRSSVPDEHATRLDSWREVEVELGPAGDERLLELVGERLRAAGARPAERTSKLARALGPAAAPPPPPPERLETLADLVRRYVTEQCDAVLAGDLAARRGEPQVHATRVAMRRLRSTLRVFGALLDPGPSARLEEELRWSAGLFGEVRDREVLQARLLGALDRLPTELVLGPVAAELEEVLGSERAAHLRTLGEELRGRRHFELLEALERWRTEPPFLEAASAPAASGRRYVKHARRKLRRRLRAALRAESGPEQEHRLHAARKAAKRARYAAELALPVWPGARRWVEEAKELQTQLGEHQDSVVAAAFLRAQGAATGARPGHNGFTYGVLLGEERERAARLRAELASAYG